MTDHSKREPQPPPEGQSLSPTGSRSVADGRLDHSVELSEFMEQLGYIMRLQRRGKGKPADVPKDGGGDARPAPKPSSGATRWVWLLLAGIGVVLATVWLAPSRGTDRLPDSATGRWITDDPRYVEREFALDSLSVVFYTGGGPADYTRHSIVGTRVHTEDGKEQVSVDYLVGDGTMTLAFWIEPGREPTIRFMNQPEIVWKRGFWPGR